jgi:hypothetical protein
MKEKEVKNLIDRSIGTKGPLNVPAFWMNKLLKDMVDLSQGNNGEAGIASLMTEVTYAELVELRDGKKLIPGHIYRMTDYEATCTWENTQVAGHPFDLVLTALDNKTLDEKCSAIWSKRDTNGYFANSNLSAWDVRYCLDNDFHRFNWAQLGGKFLIAYDEWDEYIAFQDGTIDINGVTYVKWSATNGWAILCTKTDTPQYGEEIIVIEIGYEDNPWAAFADSIEERVGGKGVIYRMIDECNNDCPYDFKNIMFIRPLTEGVLDGENGVDTFCYTFSCIQMEMYMPLSAEDLIIEDQSVKEPYCCYNNRFASYCVDNVFLTFSEDYCYSNSFGTGCYNNSFGTDCYNNSFGTDCVESIFGNGCQNNTFGYNCYTNSFGENCQNNTFGDACYSNTFGDYCYSNTFGNYCSYNTFGDNCYYNTFGGDCSSNTFGGDCYSNTFGDNCIKNNFSEYCSDNKFDTQCSDNTFGGNSALNVFFSICTHNNFGPSCIGNVFNSECSYNTLSQYCGGNRFGTMSSNNTFGKYCLRNILGSECSYNTFGTSSSNFYMSSVELKPKVKYVTLENSETSTKDIQFYTISNIAGTSSSRKSVTVQRNRTYQTYVTTKKDGTIIEYTIDDIISTQSNTPV